MTKQSWARQADKPVDLTGNPFFLDERQVEWVRATLAHMSPEEKIGQLFCLCSVEGTQEEAEAVFRVCKPGGMMLRPMRTEQAVKLTATLEKLSRIPMLIAANLEKGGSGIVTEGTLFGSPLEIAATDDPQMAEKLGATCAEEAAAVGCNWAFAPIVDVDFNFRNPITNTRTYGSDPERVKRMGLAYLGAVQSRKIATCFKHFPGDGVDERDQHLLSSVNSLSCREWDRTYGAIYKACIGAGSADLHGRAHPATGVFQKARPFAARRGHPARKLIARIETRTPARKIGFQRPDRDGRDDHGRVFDSHAA